MVMLMLVMLDGARCEWQRGSDPYRGGLPVSDLRCCRRDRLLLVLAVDRPAF
jgi:hypothetical protein